jgi:hypothetical protein
MRFFIISIKIKITWSNILYKLLSYEIIFLISDDLAGTQPLIKNIMWLQLGRKTFKINAT